MMDGLANWRPPHAYVPGVSPRHPDGLFDAIRADLEVAWRLGRDFLSEGFYWEAHEVWEPVWMAQPPNAPERALLQGLIQLANAALKARMGKERASARLMTLAERHISDALLRGDGVLLSLEDDAIRALQARIHDTIKHLNA